MKVNDDLDFSKNIMSRFNERLKNIGLNKFELAHFQSGISELEKWGVLYIFYFFLKKNVFCNVGDIADSSDIQHALKIQPKYIKLLRCLLELLVDFGCLKKIHGEIYEAAQVPLISTDYLNKVFDDIVKIYPEVIQSANFLKSVMSSYLKILSGEVNFLNIMFPSGSLSIVEGLYRSSKDAAFFNTLVSSLVNEYADFYCSHDKNQVSIIELGAGVGSTTVSILPELASSGLCSNYAYTDISKTFTRHGVSILNAGNYRFLDFFIFDINEEPGKQGVKRQYDIVVATNVLHTAKDLLTTLNYVITLLKHGGLLIINEGVIKRDFSTLVYGFLDGWWAFEDQKWRVSGSPVVCVDNWLKLLTLAGFENVFSVNRQFFLNELDCQDIICGFKKI